MSEALSLEQRVTALETKLESEIDRLYNKEFPELDTEIERVRKETRVTVDAQLANADVRVAEAEAKADRLQELVDKRLEETVNRLIAQSDSTVVLYSLRTAIKNTILKTRAATREELKAGDVVVVRPATREEIKAEGENS